MGSSSMVSSSLVSRLVFVKFVLDKGGENFLKSFAGGGGGATYKGKRGVWSGSADEGNISLRNLCESSYARVA